MLLVQLFIILAAAWIVNIQAAVGAGNRGWWALQSASALENLIHLALDCIIGPAIGINRLGSEIGYEHSASDEETESFSAGEVGFHAIGLDHLGGGMKDF
jgi:hypothetical protein